MPRRQKAPEHHIIIYPVPVPDTLADWETWETVCVPVPVPLIQYIPNLLKPLRWKGRIIGTDEQQQLFSEIWEDLITRFVIAEPCDQTGQAMKLRQNPANKCQLQQSFDNGATWSLAFDYSLCRASTSDYFFEQNVLNQFQQWQDATTLEQIHPQAPTETFSSKTGETAERKAARELALCAACKMYVDLYCESIKEINANVSALSNLFSLAASAVVAVGAATSLITLGTSTLASIALAGALGALGTAVYSGLTDAVLNDEIARQEVACCMFSALKDAEPTPVNFAAGIDDCPDISENGELIRATMAADISNPAGIENQFNAFIAVLGDALRPAELGLLPECTCGGCLSFTLLANVDPNISPFGQDSGFAVVSGHTYLIEVTGTWNYDLFAPTTAVGRVGTSGNPSALLPEANLGQVLWKVGSGGTWAAGDEAFIRTVETSGNLFFCQNDISSYDDNSGSMCVKVTEV